MIRGLRKLGLTTALRDGGAVEVLPRPGEVLAEGARALVGVYPSPAAVGHALRVWREQRGLRNPGHPSASGVVVLEVSVDTATAAACRAAEPVPWDMLVELASASAPPRAGSKGRRRLRIRLHPEWAARVQAAPEGAARRLRAMAALVAAHAVKP